MNITKTEEAGLRRLAARNGLALKKSRGAIHADNLGGFMIVDPSLNAVVAGECFDLQARDVRALLAERG